MSCTVTLTIRAESTAWGETVGVAGSIPELSAWGATPPQTLTASPFPIWTITLELPAETLVQYKYVVLSSSNIARWEMLPSEEENRSFTTPAVGETLTIDDGTMGDATRTSATVTPSTTPTATPTRVQTSNVTRDSTTETDSQPTHALAEFTAQLDNSRRQVEHVRAAVRRLRRVPTPDMLPTPPSTPNISTNLSHDAAAALVNQTLNEAKQNVDVIRQKLRAVRSARSQASANGSKPGVVGGVLSCAVLVLLIGAVFMDTRIGDYVGRATGISREMAFDGAGEAWMKVRRFGESTLRARKRWCDDMGMKLQSTSVRWAQSGARITERAKTRFTLDRLAERFAGMCKNVGESVGGLVRKGVARLGELRRT